MRKKTAFNLVIIICAIGIIIASIGIWNAFQYKDIEQGDLVVLNGYLSDNPHKKTTGGKNPSTYLVLSFNQFSGNAFKTPLSYFIPEDAHYFLNHMKYGDSVEIGILKEDFHFLKSGNRDWSLTGGFSSFNKMNNISLYQLYHKDREVLNIDLINSTRQDQKGSSFWGFGFLFVICFSVMRWAIGERRSLGQKQAKS